MKQVLPYVTLLLCISINSHAQVIRDYGIIYTSNIKGGHTMFGNTILARSDASSSMTDFSMSNTGSYSYGRTSAYGNDNSNMINVDADGSGNATSLMAYGGQWRYYTANNYNSAPPIISSINWKQDTYNDATNWTNTTTPFGINETGVTSLSSNNRTTYYLRRDINITNPAQYAAIRITAQYDDGIIIYVNGIERGRVNISNTNQQYSTLADGTREYGDGDYVINLSPSYFTNGNNQIAVEVHQGSNNSSDLYFNMKLEGVDAGINTVNSSTADLIMPSTGTNTIKFARLYWGGRITNSAYTDAQLKTIKIRKGTSGAYTAITASTVDKSVGSAVTSYQSFVDVTNFIASNGTGTYTVADIAASTGNSISGGAYGGWTIVVVYENLLQPYRSVRIYDGFLEIQSGGSKTVTLNGLDVPLNATLKQSDAYMSVMAWEGDANLGASSSNPQGDYVKVNNIAVSNGVNPAVNMWNGTISKNGAHVTTKFPDYKNQMGLDIDELEVGTGYAIKPGDKTVNVQFGTEQDQYFPSLFAFSIIMKDPAISIQTSITDINGGALQINDPLYFTSTGTNTGEGAAYGSQIASTLPSTVTYIPSSVEIWNGSAWVPYSNVTVSTDPASGKTVVTVNIGTGSTTTAGGTLAPQQSFQIRFKVIYSSAGVVTNTSTVAATNQAAVESYKNEASASIGTEVILPVIFKSFNGTAKNNTAVLVWTTAVEENVSHFEIERSTDGKTFKKAGTIAAQGNSNIEHTYQYTEAFSNAIVYYRLKVVDIDGKTNYSKIIVLSSNNNLQGKSISIYPNPLSSGQDLKLMIQSEREQDIYINVMNNSGIVLITVKRMVQAGSNILVLEELNKLSPGAYVMHISKGTSKNAQVFIKY